jgi:hypothetical protein
LARMGAAGRRPRAPSPATETSTARRPGHSNATLALAAARLEARRGGKANLLTGWRRDACCTTARRGVFPSLSCRSSLRPKNWRKHWDDAAWGSHVPRLPLAHRDAAAPMGRRRRDALGHGGSMARAQAGKVRYGARRKESGLGAHSGSTVKSSQTRCGRRCGVGVEVHGGALLRYGFLSVALASFSRPAPHGLVPPPQQRAGGGARRFPASPLLPQLPLSSSPPPAERHWQGGKTPMWVGSGGRLALALHPLLNPRRREVKASFRCCPSGLDRLAPVAAARALSPRSRCHCEKAQG